jgi:hypothetical protein
MVLQKMVDGVIMDMTPEEEADHLRMIADIEAEAKRTEYVKERLSGDPQYGSIESQLDLMYHQGFDAWVAHIKAVKEAHPKPKDVS